MQMIPERNKYPAPGRGPVGDFPDYRGDTFVAVGWGPGKVVVPDRSQISI